MTTYKSYIYFNQHDRTYTEILEMTASSLRYFQRAMHWHLLDDGDHAEVYAVRGDKEVFIGRYFGHNDWVRA